MDPEKAGDKIELPKKKMGRPKKDPAITRDEQLRRASATFYEKNKEKVAENSRRRYRIKHGLPLDHTRHQCPHLEGGIQCTNMTYKEHCHLHNKNDANE
jgi:hypothetical protein